VKTGILALILALAPASAGQPTVERFAPRTWFVQDALPQKVQWDTMRNRVPANPLDYCAQRIGLDIRNIELPRGWEGGYRFCSRSPTIDAVANRPLYLKQWAEENSDSITGQHRAVGLAVVNSALSLLRGTPELKGYVVATITGVSDFARELWNSGFTEKYQQALLRLYLAFYRAQQQGKKIRGGLAHDDLRFFDANPGCFLAPDGKKMPELTGDNSTELEFIARARRVRYAEIHYAAYIAVGGVQEYLAATRNWGPADFYADLSKSRQPFIFRTKYGLLRVSGVGCDTATEDCALLIDLGGDDVYRNNAGGCWTAEAPIALCIDHAGNDQYVSDRPYVQGFGFLGVGLLVDVAGNDRYVARHFAQGAGIMGVGALWDLGGDDVYDGHAFVQGAGMFGLGMLLDDAGDDQYDGATLCQGAATTLGLGVLSDLEGNDQYGLAVKPDRDALGQPPGYGQGGALSFRPYPWEGKLTAYGGVGMLIDDQGDDRYESRGWNDQGGSYIMSLGVLVDNSGDDHYLGGTSQGSGIHITNAILIDRAGNDLYEGGFRAGGSGGDRTPAFLIDYAGNDTYRSASSSYGTACKPFGIGLMIDYQGDDHYVSADTSGKVLFNRWESFGGTWPESESYLWPYAICLDLGGKDSYQVRHHENNAEWGSFGHGISLDTEWPGGDVIGRVENPLPAYPGQQSSRGMPMDPNLTVVLQLQDPDNFQRFQAVGRIVERGSQMAPVLVSVLQESENRQFNRDALECLHYLLVEKKVEDGQVPILAQLLRARDPEVRIMMADNFGVFRLAGAEDALVAALQDSIASVRRFALRSLAALKSLKSVPVAQRLALNDTSEDVRRTAVRLLSRIGGDSVSGRVLRVVLEQGPGISEQVAAADGVAYRQDTAAVNILREVAESYDVYLQRAAGKALAELGHVEGIDLLIKSLSFPSIDAFVNYDRNVPNSIAAYANFDLPESLRYEPKAWREWFDQNRSRIDISANARAYRALTMLEDSLRSAPDTQQIQGYEELLRRHPRYRRIGKTLAAKLNGIAWNMVTSASVSKVHNPKQGLSYARRAVELVEDPNYWDTLIEALLANGMNDEARRITQDAMKRYPGNALFSDRLK
jgi:HEAT repeat protein